LKEFSQLGGAPPHFSSRVRAFLDREIPDRWIGNGGPIPWLPPSLSKFYSYGFLLLGVCRKVVYREKVQNVNELRDRISSISGSVTSEMLSSTCPLTEHRLDVCRATNGAIFRSTEQIRSFVESSV